VEHKTWGCNNRAWIQFLWLAGRTCTSEHLVHFTRKLVHLINYKSVYLCYVCTVLLLMTDTFIGDAMWASSLLCGSLDSAHYGSCLSVCLSVCCPVMAADLTTKGPRKPYLVWMHCPQGRNIQCASFQFKRLKVRWMAAIRCIMCWHWSNIFLVEFSLDKGDNVFTWICLVFYSFCMPMIFFCKLRRGVA